MYVSRLENAGNGEDFGYRAAALSSLMKTGLQVPKGFAVSAAALKKFVSSNGLEEKIRELMTESGRSMKDKDNALKELFSGASMPPELRNEILTAYGELSVSADVRGTGAAFDLIRAGREHQLVSVRTSLLREGGNSFAGVAESYLNVSGEDQLFRAVKMCWASVFSPFMRAYREKKNIENSGVAVVVQKMADSEKSGMMLTCFGTDKILVEASWGLGNAVSSGETTPDEYLLDSAGNLMEKNIAKKLWLYSRNPSNGRTERQHVPGNSMDAQTLSENELKRLWEAAQKISSLFPGQRIIDWCMGRSRVSILDVRQEKYDIPMNQPDEAGNVLVTGRYVSGGTAKARVKIPDNGNTEAEGRILVSRQVKSKDILSSGKVEGIIADEGGRLCNASILSRELGIPMLAATRNATAILRDDIMVRLVPEQGKALSAEEAAVPADQSDGLALPSQENSVTYGSGETTPGAEKETRIFAVTDPENAADVQGMDGILIRSPEITDTMHLQIPESVPVWLASEGQSDAKGSMNVFSRLYAEGLRNGGFLLTVTRGAEEIQNARETIPEGSELGISIKTPAMALLLDPLLRGRVSVVNIEMKSLVQLTMGLQSPGETLHPAVEALVSGIMEKCKERGIKTFVTLSGEHLSEKTVDYFSQKGVDVIAVEPGSLENVRKMLAGNEERTELPFIDSGNPENGSTFSSFS